MLASVLSLVVLFITVCLAQQGSPAPSSNAPAPPASAATIANGNSNGVSGSAVAGTGSNPSAVIASGSPSGVAVASGPTNGAAPTAAGAVPTASATPNLNIESLILQLTPCATECLSQLPAVLQQLNVDTSSNLMSQALALCEQNKALISTCSTSCNSSILGTLATSCATVGAAGSVAQGASSPIPTVRNAPAYSHGQSILREMGNSLILPAVFAVAGIVFM
ncbi:hypothetical protein BC830DRAFT_1162801 [Chytriomyces sp. MP71]|nr:hypothetical protein BC830DRAFT_1162801 [Chytriomyces sp. MP71]